MKEIVIEIIRQLGGQARLKVMLGAENFIMSQANEETSLSFKIQASRIVDFVSITLTWKDLYNISLTRIKKDGIGVEEVYSVEDIDVENLIEILEEQTDCAWSLNRPKKVKS